ncbi:MAG: DUF4349 domain-containing protein [Chloroflexi bacterium]|nr:DUF4349 domain-containing protein [Chloroflexota bacterium]
MKKKLAPVVLILIVTLLLSACQSASSPTNFAPSAPDMYLMDESRVESSAEYAAPFATSAPVPMMADKASGGDLGAAVERVVIKNADLTIVVADPGEAMASIGKMAEGMGGFIVSSNLYKTYTDEGVEIPEASITVRVPAEQLTSAMDQIKGLVEDPTQDIRSENVSGQDVTREYTDLKSRLRNLEQADAQLREIMASANRTEDVLSVYNQLVSIEEQIEVLKGQIQYYDEASSLSAISIRIMSQAAVAPLTIGSWEPVGVARDAIQALINALKFLANAAIWLVLFLVPVALIIVIPVRLLWVFIRKWFAKRKAARAVPPAPPAPPAEKA